MRGNFVDPNHAMHAGMAYGVLAAAGLQVHSMADGDADYLDVLVVVDEQGREYHLRVLPEQFR